ncbi:c-type cytochrome biogenesis protein CcsB [Nocardioides sp. zg-536]|uniref:Heme exporter protein C n=1 Tax=Nocardioides faecalis TaxID=2803858 RepID=A0A939BWX7_9ACTN|nr:c-type cytochrome biogenesis protein CcsB [Nocardioides faecalis]MBM9461097.1 c-type cytochrome biogenesis protein CcsB [Nocardioides faecalis]MBS4751998.1 c-type cytochrome biogenesis protein CcsB [Nocardioides faecalis]QVI59176.1 c-type cytochrome biogenesis protein CcsB [Nocardioides faecalis]
MSNTAWENLSNQATAMAGMVYFLALIVYLAEWAAVRHTAADRELVAAGVGGPGEAPATAAPTGASEPGRRVAFLGRLGILLTFIAVGVHLVALVGRGMAADPNRVPWGNMYEFTLSGSFVVALLYVVLYRRFDLAWMGPLVVGFVVTVLMVAAIWLYDEVAPLTEALNSPWLVIHVVSAVIATGAFSLGGLVSIMYLVRMRAERRARAAERELTGWIARVPELDGLDRLAYRVHAFAFPVWTFAVLITGPIWAHEAWSRYWNWDPKEVWAFITWVVYAGYLHARATAGWKGRKAALLALVGLATLWFNFIGINYFSTTSQHSYALEHTVERTVQPAPGEDPGSLRVQDA